MGGCQNLFCFSRVTKRKEETWVRNTHVQSFMCLLKLFYSTWSQTLACFELFVQKQSKINKVVMNMAMQLMNTPMFTYPHLPSSKRHSCVMSCVHAYVTPRQHNLLHESVVKQVSIYTTHFFKEQEKQKKNVKEEQYYMHERVCDHVALWKFKNYTRNIYMDM